MGGDDDVCGDDCVIVEVVGGVVSSVFVKQSKVLFFTHRQTPPMAILVRSHLATQLPWLPPRLRT